MLPCSMQRGIESHRSGTQEDGVRPGTHLAPLLLHHFVCTTGPHRFRLAIWPEQMDGIMVAERRVIEGIPERSDDGYRLSWWYFNDLDAGSLQVEAGCSPAEAREVWNGRWIDAYVGRLPPLGGH